MSKLQLIVLSSAFFLFCFLYFVLDTKPRTHSDIEKIRIQNAESTNINALLLDARKTLNPEQATRLLTIDKQINVDGVADSTKVRLLKEFSSNWYEFGHAAIAGYYAEQAAEIENTEDAWSIAGTSYVIGLKQNEDQKVKEYCSKRAQRAFENAISMNPSNVNHKINLALCFVEAPPQENPMKGILMLRQLNEKHPENVAVLNNLARLAIRTNQFDKAVERLTTAINIESDNIMSNCLLAQAYEGLNDVSKAEAYNKKCAALRE